MVRGEKLNRHDFTQNKNKETISCLSVSLLNFVILGDSVKLDESVVENELNAIGALVPNEKIKLAYKCGRDMVICTSKRMLYVDTQGFSGKRIEYLSMRYSCIKGYEVETAGSWDRDAEFKIFTNISQEKRCLKTDLRKGQCDVMEVLWYFNNRLLGVDSMTLEEFLPLGNTFIKLHKYIPFFFF